MRAAALRAVRLLTNSDTDVCSVLSINLHHLIVRSLDLDIDNKLERVQALKLLRKCIFLGPSHVPSAPCRALVALVDGGIVEKDRLYRSAIAVLCELSVLNPLAFVNANAASALTRALLDCTAARVADAIIDCLLALHNNPATRYSQ